MRKLNQRQQAFLKQTRQRFIQERVNGYLDTAGNHHAPIDLQEAERAWQAHIQRFEDAVFDPEVIQKLELAKDEPIPAEWIKEVTV